MVKRRDFWEWDENGVSRGERSYVPADEFDAAVALLREALQEMCTTKATRNSFTDCVDQIDAFLTRCSTNDAAVDASK